MHSINAVLVCPNIGTFPSLAQSSFDGCSYAWGEFHFCAVATPSPRRCEKRSSRRSLHAIDDVRTQRSTVSAGVPGVDAAVLRSSIWATQKETICFMSLAMSVRVPGRSIEGPAWRHMEREWKRSSKLSVRRGHTKASRRSVRARSGSEGKELHTWVEKRNMGVGLEDEIWSQSHSFSSASVSLSDPSTPSISPRSTLSTMYDATSTRCFSISDPVGACSRPSPTTVSASLATAHRNVSRTCFVGCWFAPRHVASTQSSSSASASPALFLSSAYKKWRKRSTKFSCARSPVSDKRTLSGCSAGAAPCACAGGSSALNHPPVCSGASSARHTKISRPALRTSSFSEWQQSDARRRHASSTSPVPAGLQRSRALWSRLSPSELNCRFAVSCRRATTLSTLTSASPSATCRARRSGKAGPSLTCSVSQSSTSTRMSCSNRHSRSKRRSCSGIESSLRTAAGAISVTALRFMHPPWVYSGFFPSIIARSARVCTGSPSVMAAAMRLEAAQKMRSMSFT
mmetsp:Transcript_38964/g.95868  ORF Transcript_38964/g.95868 Transcript_38964/m.95868 type:complete len:514 (+) Transcript_38964:856-2397(+)